MSRWVPIDKGFLRELPKDRPYTKLEAVFSLSCDYDNGETATIQGYASLWRWSCGKVRRFLDDVGAVLEYPENTSRRQNQRGQIMIQIADRSRTENGQIKIIDSKWLASEADRKRTDDEQKTDRSRSATKNPNPKPISIDSFSAFWDAYPRKVGKVQASKSWAKLNPDSALQGQIFKSLEWQTQQPDWKKDGGKFIPHAATWLNGRRWEDERPQSSGQGDGIGYCR